MVTVCNVFHFVLHTDLRLCFVKFKLFETFGHFKIKMSSVFLSFAVDILITLCSNKLLQIDAH